MPVFQFPCPHCQAKLRVPDRSFQGRNFHCPECRSVIRIVAAGEGHLKAVPVGVTPPAATQKSASSSTSPAKQFGGVRPFAEAVLARRIAWSVAACLLIGTIIAVVRSGGDEDLQAITEPQVDVVAAPDHQQAALPADAVADVPADAFPASDNDLLAARLKVLWSDIDGYRNEHGHYPPGQVDGDDLPPSERFSWLAAMWVQSGRAPAVPLWNEGWRAPLNRPFSSAEFPDVRNPLIDGPEKAAGYPVTHFAGVAGVGPDAARLRADNPRAGIFGDTRQTRLEDIRDGTANTMLVAGVSEDPGPWAAAGRSTIRAFTQEPYVNGPDGFGTGQPDSMLVLMADGSVRTISNATSPVIVRRMAAMADGWPLDPAVPGEPGDSAPQPPQLAGQPREIPEPIPGPNRPREPDGGRPVDEPRPDDLEADEPILVELAPDAPDFDVDGALSRTIIAFEQPTPVAFITLLRQLQELAGVPFVLDVPVDEQHLQQAVTLSAEDATIGEILALLLEKTGLRYEARRDGVHILTDDAPLPMLDE